METVSPYDDCIRTRRGKLRVLFSGCPPIVWLPFSISFSTTVALSSPGGFLVVFRDRPRPFPDGRHVEIQYSQMHEQVQLPSSVLSLLQLRHFHQHSKRKLSLYTFHKMNDRADIERAAVSSSATLSPIPQGYTNGLSLLTGQPSWR